MASTRASKACRSTISAVRRWTRRWPNWKKSVPVWLTSWGEQTCEPLVAPTDTRAGANRASSNKSAQWGGFGRPTALERQSRPRGGDRGATSLRHSAKMTGHSGEAMTMSPSAGARFRAAVAEESPLQVMGAITAYAGLMAKRTGYKALYLSGGGVAANSLGMPDLGISTMEDVLIDARRIVDATQMPLLVDIDTGWGGAFNIARAIRNFTNIGVAAVHMEDQVGQKRCGHRPGKEVVTKDEMVDRVKAAVDARTDDGFVIMARTDAAAVEGIDSAIDRACAYVEAGADMIFPEAMKTLEDYKRFRAAVRVPILANLTEFGSTPFFTTDELRGANVDIALYCCGAYRAMNKGALHFYETVRREGTQKHIIDALQTRTELYDFLGYHAYEDKLDALFSKTPK